jgi:conserved oligomeric Golgi complex subunit 6
MATPTISTDVPLTEPRQRVLSSRISNVLAAPYSDLELRDALVILDRQGFKNTVESRRQLRLDCQEEVIKQNGQILSDFGQVAAELGEVERILNNLTSTCTTLRKKIQVANRATGPLREEATTLFKQKRDVDTKQSILQAFQAHFLITDAEITSLVSSSEPVDSVFFSALSKLKRIHADTGLLLSAQNDRLGLSILDQSSKMLNTAFQKLFRWAQKEFHTLDLENPRLSASMRRALRVLAERPALFASSLDHFANAREEVLSASFHAALTGDGGESMIGKPIEFQAHDPLRYISDMLAWAHSATVGEREALEVLFIGGEGEELAHTLREGLTKDPWAQSVDGENGASQEPFDPRQALDELVSRDIAGVVNATKTRIEQVIHGQEDAVVTYRINNLLLFYNRTFAKLLGPLSHVVSVIESLEALTHTQFSNIMGDLVAQIEIDALPTDDSVPVFLTEALITLAALLKSYDTSLFSASSTPISPQTLDAALSAPSAASSPSSSRSPSLNGRKAEPPFSHPLEILLRTALSPFLSAGLLVASRLPLPLSAIMSLNSLSVTHSTLTTSFSFSTSPCTPVLPALSSLAALHAELLSNHILATMLASSGCGPLFSSILPIAPDDTESLLKLSIIKNQRELAEAARRLDAWLPGAMMTAAEECAGLLAVGVVTGEEVRARAAERYVEGFIGVVERIESVDTFNLEQYEKNKAEEEDEDDDERPKRLRDIFPRTAQEIAVLLS